MSQPSEEKNMICASCGEEVPRLLPKEKEGGNLCELCRVLHIGIKTILK